jgi:hypothetical protein
MAQVWLPPADTATNVPAGMLFNWPAALLPQHEIVPAMAIAHVWNDPAATAVNVPDGMLFNCPTELSPQHTMLPPLATAQL